MSASTSTDRSWHVLVPDARDARILLRLSRGGCTLPAIELDDVQPWWRHTSEIRARVQAALALDASVLRCMESREHFEPESRTVVFVLEPRQLDWARPSGTDWFGPDDFGELEFADERQAEIVKRYFSDEVSELPPWMRRGWMTSAVSWLETEFERLELHATGRIEQLRASSTSALLRIPVEEERVLLRACGEASAYEPELTALLTRECPRLLPRLLAADAKRRFLLFQDPGESAPIDVQTAEWLIRGLAEVQIQSAELPERLLEVGCPDDRPELLRARVANLVEALAPVMAGMSLPDAVLERVSALPEMQDAWAELSEGEIPAALHHPAFGPASVRVRSGHSCVIAWAGSLSHPFFTPSLLIESFAEPEIRERLTEIYLEHWTTFASRERASLLYARARALEPVYRIMRDLERLEQLRTLGERRALLDRLRHWLLRLGPLHPAG